VEQLTKFKLTVNARRAHVAALLARADDVIE
jgi:hypothetical protein